MNSENNTNMTDSEDNKHLRVRTLRINPIYVIVNNKLKRRNELTPAEHQALTAYEAEENIRLAREKANLMKQPFSSIKMR